MRWLFLILTVLCVGVAFITDNANVMGVAMVLMMLFAFIAVMGFAQARIESVAQPQASMIGTRDVQQLRQQALQKKVAQTRAAAGPAPVRHQDADDDRLG